MIAVRASSLILSPNLGATVSISIYYDKLCVLFTLEKYSISKRVQRPYIRRPVCMTEASGEGEEPCKKLVDLAPIKKWAESDTKDEHEPKSKSQTITEAYPEDKFRTEAVDSK